VLKLSLILLSCELALSGQTQINLQNQAKAGVGTVLPATCSPGQMFYKTIVNLLYTCTRTNTWTLPSGGGVGVWGGIIGLLSDQTDVFGALAGKQPVITGAPGMWPSFATVAITGNYTDLGGKPTIPANTSQIFELGNLYFTTPRARGSFTGGGPIVVDPVTGIISCPSCGISTGGIGSINGLTATTQVWAASNDTNVTLTLGTSGTDTQTFNLAWIGALSKVRQNPLTLYSDGSYTNPAAFHFSLGGGLLTGFGGAAALNVGVIGGTVAAGNDTRLSDARAPTAHAATHKTGGGDEVAVAAAAANAIPKAGAGGNLDIGWIPTGITGATVAAGNDARLSDARTPTAHAASHLSSGADPIPAATAAVRGTVLTTTATSRVVSTDDSRMLDATGLPTGIYCNSVVSGSLLGLTSCIGGSILFDSQIGLFDSAAGLFDGSVSSTPLADPGLPGIIKRTSPGSTAIAVPGTDYQAPLGFTAENVANKDAVIGYAGLDGAGKLKLAEAPIWNQSTTGNAATATTVAALSALPTPCSSGSAPTGILANGNAIGCTAYGLALGFTPENVANKGAAGGYSSLDGSAKIPIAQLPTGSTGTTVPFGNDGRFSDARTPIGHAASHISGGTDPIPAATASVRGTVTTTTATSQVVSTDDARMTNARTPTAHAATHSTGGTDPVTLLAAQITGLAASATTDTSHAMSGTFSVNLLGAVVGDSGSILIEESKAIHITRIACNVLGGTNVVLALDKRTEAAPDTDSGHHMIADLTCTAGALVTTATFANGSGQCGGTGSCAVVARIPLAVTITSVSGTNTALRVFGEYSIDP
jgi:hypothetical protein